MHYNMGPADDHARWTFSRLRFLTCLLKDELRRDSLWDDFTQELYATAYDAWQQGMDITETRRYASRRIHTFLKSYGYKAYRNSYVRQETPFAATFPDWLVENLPAADQPLHKSFDYDIGLKASIERNLQNHPQGMTRSRLSTNLEAPVKDIQRFLDSLVKEGKVVEFKRETWDGHITPLYFVAGAKLPEASNVRTEMYERIRRAYFEEGLSVNRICEEYHHSETTVKEAIRTAPAFLRPVIPQRKRRQMEMYQEIRRLYLLEGKSSRQIASEYHHSLQTVAKAIHSAPAPEVDTREKVLVLA